MKSLYLTLWNSINPNISYKNSQMKWLFVLLLNAFSPSLFCQQEGEFKKFLTLDFVGEKQIDIAQDSTVLETIYLGKLDMKEGDFHSKSVTYHVLTQFTTVQAAIGKHGHSRLIFTGEDGKVIKIYTVDLPEELPTGIKNNGLTFGETTMRYVSLPDLFCIPNGACFD